MEINFIRETGGNFMEIRENGIQESFEMKMVRNNRIKGLLPVQVRQVNSEYRYLYCINSKRSIAENYGRNGMGSRELEILAESLKEISKSLKEYMLDESGLVLLPEYVFRDMASDRFCFAYTGLVTEDFRERLRKLFEYILGITDHRDNEAVTLAYGIYKRLCTDDCTMDELFEHIRSNNSDSGRIETTVTENTSVLPEIVEEEREVRDYAKIYACIGVAGLTGVIFLIFFLFLLFNSIRPSALNRMFCGLMCVICGTGEYFIYRWYVENKDFFVKTVRKEVSIPYAEESVNIILPPKNEESGTVILSGYEAEHELMWQEEGILRRFTVKGDTVIGSSEEKSDCVIHFPGVSRMHAKIIKEDNRFFVKDLNSTNGTLVNGNVLACYQVMPLEKNDTLTLGRLKLMFN